MRLLLTGASGFFGQHFAPLAAARFELFSAYFSHPEHITAGTPLQLDLQDEAWTRRALETMRPDAIVHAAASNRDEQSIEAIRPAIRSLAGYAQAHSARLVHFSTDLVFDGEHAPYGDGSPPAPIAPYGEAKAEAEAMVQALNPAALIVRPSLIYGFDPIDTQTAWLVAGLQQGQPVRLFTDEFRCPVWVHDLSAAMLEIVSPGAPTLAGPMNLGGPQALSRWDFGMKLLAALKLEAGPNVTPSTVAESGLKRARNLTMLGERATRVLKTKLRTVDEVIEVWRSVE